MEFHSNYDILVVYSFTSCLFVCHLISLFPLHNLPVFGGQSRSNLLKMEADNSGRNRRHASSHEMLSRALEYDRDDNDPSSSTFVYNRYARLALEEQRRRLPIARYRNEILYLVEKHATVIIVGHTGCGKTTQIPQFLYESGWTKNGQRIICTQPRRIAVVSVAQRVAEEMACPVGTLVGYQIRFEEKIHESKTKVKFSTDDALLREIMENPLLEKYSIVMIDEAHERTLTTDLLLGLLKKIQRRRADLRVIISSATMDAEHFAKFFRQRKNAQHKTNGNDVLNPEPAIMSVEGVLHDVDVFYRDRPTGNYIVDAVETILKIHMHEKPGDILVFFPTNDDVAQAMDIIWNQLDSIRADDKLLPMVLHSGLSPSKQLQVFRLTPRNCRKVVIATSIAETSVTIDGIAYVVDSCFKREKCYNPLSGIDTIVVAPESKSSAIQRSGRAGRVRPGKCYRLCTRDSYMTMLPQAPIPEMQRSELSQTVLQLKALGIDSIMSFDWIAPPSAEAMIRALELLHALGALDSEAKLTSPLGMHMAELQVHPMIGKSLLVSGELKCVEELLLISSMMTVKSIWQLHDGRRRVDECKSKFAVAEGDHISFLNVVKAFQDSKLSKRWCNRNCVNYNAMMRILEIKDQLLEKVKAFGIMHSSSGRNMLPVRRALTFGYFANAANLNSRATDGKGRAEYTSIRGKISMRIHTSSFVYRTQPSCVLFSSAIQTGTDSHEMYEVASIEQDWLVEVAPHFYENMKQQQVQG